MATDWAADVKMHVPDADDAVVDKIVKHCGIALRSRDSALVSGGDKKELDRVRDGFMKKKLGLTDDDASLDATLKEVVQSIPGNRARPTVYYKLADHYDKLDLFR